LFCHDSYGIYSDQDLVTGKRTRIGVDEKMALVSVLLDVQGLSKDMQGLAKDIRIKEGEYQLTKNELQQTVVELLRKSHAVSARGVLGMLSTPLFFWRHIVTVVCVRYIGRVLFT
jgi:hypothetical protein